MTDADNLFSAAGFAERLRACFPDGGGLSADAAARQHGPSVAVLVPIVNRSRNASVLFTVRSAAAGSRSRQISFPGMKIAAGDRSPAHTALRGAYTEIALEPHKVSLVGTIPAYHTDKGYSVQPVIGILPPGLSYTFNDGSVQSVFDVPLSFLMNPANHERCERVADGGRKYSFYAIGYRGYFIWGVTAGIIRTVYERLYS